MEYLADKVDIRSKILKAADVGIAPEDELALYTNDRTLFHYLSIGQTEIPSYLWLKKNSDNEVKLTKSPADSKKSMEMDALSALALEVAETKPNDETIIEHIEYQAFNQLSKDAPMILEVDSIQNRSTHVDHEPTITDHITPSVPMSSEIHPDAEKQMLKIKKTKKKKSDKYKLKEYSGISPFSKWLLSLKTPDLEKKIRKEDKQAKKRELEQNARKSIKKTDQILSEPLAELLVMQGHVDDAKKMYSLLMQKYPEKSSYFAAKINQIYQN